VGEGSEERRTEAVNIRFRPSIRAAIEEDRQAKGQKLVEWLERAALAQLDRSAS
jgi:hypothetical protein